MKNPQIYHLDNDWGLFIDIDSYNIREYNNKYNKYHEYNLFTIYEDDEYKNLLWLDIIIEYFCNLLNKLWIFFNKPNRNSVNYM